MEENIEHIEHIGQPNTAPTPEAIAQAAAAIVGVGAVAAGPLVEAPALADISATSGEGQSSIGRRWGAIREAFDVRKSAAGRVVSEAGVKFSKWEMAKASVCELIGSAPAMVREFRTKMSEVKGRPVSDKLEYQNARSLAGVANPVMRKKLAKALLQGPYSNNPVNMHLWERKQNGRATGEALRAEVQRTADRVRRRQARPEAAVLAQRLGTSFLGTIAVAAAFSHLA